MKPLHLILVAGGLLLVLLLALGGRRSATPIAASPTGPAPANQIPELAGSRSPETTRTPAAGVASTAEVEATAVESLLPDEPEPYPPGLSGVSDLGLQFYGSKTDKFSVRAFFGENRWSIRIVSYCKTVPGHPEEQAEIFAAPFCPTTFVKLSNGCLAVGGIGMENGHSIIELWRFDPPRGSAGATPSWLAAQRRAVERIYDERSTRRHVVQYMMPFWGGANEALLVAFRSSNDLFSVDTHHVCRVVASPELVSRPEILGNAVNAPFLRSTEGGNAGELVNGGYVYRFWERSSAPAESIHLLLDANKDGVIDEAQTLSVREFDNLGYGHAAAWVEH